MLTWTNWKNNQGAKRSDGLYIRRSWGWLDLVGGKPRTCKGWDLCTGLRLHGTLKDRPLVEATVLVDTLMPEGARYPTRSGMFSHFECPECRQDSMVKGTFARLVTCVHCGHGIRHPPTWEARELEVMPEWVFSAEVEIVYGTQG